MNTFTQIYAITALNLRSIPQRMGSSLVIVIGIAGVVAVLVSVLAMSVGFRKTMLGTGRADRAVVLRAGSVNEISSTMALDAVNIIADAPGVKRDADGKPIYSGQVLTTFQMTKKDGTNGSLPLRGVRRNLLELQPEIRMTTGRMFEPGVNEVIVGKGGQTLYRNLEVGSEFKRQNVVWKVVGVFESHGDARESEMITSDVMLQNAMHWEGLFRGALVMLDSPAALSKFKDALTSNPNLTVDVVSEREYYAQQSQGVSRVLGIVATFVGSIMAIGAIFAALNAMYSAVSTRMVEIATLRALGFGAGPIVISVMVEATFLALIGGAIGACLSWLFFSGFTVSTSTGQTTQVFNLFVSPELVLTGIVWASFIGLVGGLFPAISSARMSVATTLRGV